MRYVYVQALLDTTFDHTPGVDLPPCFRHTFVDAESDDAAYAAGQQWADTQPRQSVLNDYVLAV